MGNLACRISFSTRGDALLAGLSAGLAEADGAAAVDAVDADHPVTLAIGATWQGGALRLPPVKVMGASMGPAPVRRGAR